MRHLPTQFVTLRLVTGTTIVDNQFLLSTIDSYSVTVIDRSGKSNYFLTSQDGNSTSTQDGNSTSTHVESITYLDDDGDDYVEFVSDVMVEDMKKDLHHLSEIVKSKFDELMNYTPEDYGTLSDMLVGLIVNSDKD
jgi:hypothetical protein